MSENENKNRFYEISSPSNSNFAKTSELNDKKEPEKKDNDDHNNQGKTSKIFNEEKEVNISPKESTTMKDVVNQKKEYSLNNSFEKKENKSEEKKEDTNLNNDEENNVITNNEMKEEKTDEVNVNNSEDKNIITHNEIKEENNLNQNEINNNNITSMLNLTNTDIMNLVKSQSYLTNLPLPKNKTNITNQDNEIKLLKLKRQDKKTYNNLKEKENSICLEINAIKQKKLNLENYTYDLFGAKNVVENNIINNELRKLKNNENNL